jgi:hypothetical protein
MISIPSFALTDSEEKIAYAWGDQFLISKGFKIEERVIILSSTAIGKEVFDVIQKHGWNNFSKRQIEERVSAVIYTEIFNFVVDQGIKILNQKEQNSNERDRNIVNQN